MIASTAAWRRLARHSSLVLLFAGLAATPAQALTGVASFYGAELHGKRTASGERFNKNGLSAAHRSAPFGSRLRVTNLSNGRAVIVRVNDRGPFVRGRLIDVSLGAARTLGFVARGTARVRIDRE